MPADEKVSWELIVRRLVEDCVHPPVSDIRVARNASEITVEFEGNPSFRPGRFGTRFRVPLSLEDPCWDDYGGHADGDYENFAYLAVMIQVEERYVAVDDEMIPSPDERGIRWLPE